MSNTCNGTNYSSGISTGIDCNHKNIFSPPGLGLEPLPIPHKNEFLHNSFVDSQPTSGPHPPVCHTLWNNIGLNSGIDTRRVSNGDIPVSISGPIRRPDWISATPSSVHDTEEIMGSRALLDDNDDELNEDEILAESVRDSLVALAVDREPINSSIPIFGNRSKDTINLYVIF